MVRGPKKHMKRLNAPKHWMLSKMGGIWAPKPTAGPHKVRECLPLSLIVRNRLKYALTRRESMMILMQKLVKIDGRVRTELNYPAGFMGAWTRRERAAAGRACARARARARVRRAEEGAPPDGPAQRSAELRLPLHSTQQQQTRRLSAPRPASSPPLPALARPRPWRPARLVPRSPAADVIEIPQSDDRMRLLYDTKGRFVLHKISSEEAGFKLCRVVGSGTQARQVPYITTHDGRTIRYPDPAIKKHDVVKVDLATGKAVEHIKFELGNLVMCTKGGNTGRIGTLTTIEKHPGSFDIVHVKDVEGNVFATRLGNVFSVGKGDLKSAMVSLPRGKGVKRTIFELRDRGSAVAQA